MSRLINWWRYKANKVVTLSIVSLHLISLLVFFPQFFSWSGLAWFFILYWITAGLGITLCYHRLLTHRSFSTPIWFRNVLTICSCLSWQGSPISWIGTHRAHHAHSDTDEDPHTPRHGFNWAHIIWLFTKSDFEPKNLAKDLERDPFMNSLEYWFWVPQVILTIFLYALGYVLGGHNLAISWVAWGIALRTVVVFHGTWFVNSATHTWGYQNKDTGDDSKNLWWVALLSFGEGWHNNHHKYQTSARHGLLKSEPDLTFWTIKLLELVGLAKDIKTPTRTE